jgi:hypothetical protein
MGKVEQYIYTYNDDAINYDNETFSFYEVLRILDETINDAFMDLLPKYLKKIYEKPEYVLFYIIDGIILLYKEMGFDIDKDYYYDKDALNYFVITLKKEFDKNQHKALMNVLSQKPIIIKETYEKLKSKLKSATELYGGVDVVNNTSLIKNFGKKKFLYILKYIDFGVYMGIISLTLSNLKERGYVTIYDVVSNINEHLLIVLFLYTINKYKKDIETSFIYFFWNLILILLDIPSVKPENIVIEKEDFKNLWERMIKIDKKIYEYDDSKSDIYLEQINGLLEILK